jgi:acetyl-CoA carboxylase biotin carboxyl carrier protein
MARGKSKAGDAGEHDNEDALVTMARGLAEIAASHDLSELILDTKEVKLTVRRGSTIVHAAPAHVMQHAPAAHAPAAFAPAAHAPPPAAEKPVDDKAHVVTSPFVGTFYRKPNPDSPSYVAMGDKVDKGQVLCIVEAMKLMNEIEADVAGVITQILVEDGQSVEYGQALFKIRN